MFKYPRLHKKKIVTTEYYKIIQEEDENDQTEETTSEFSNSYQPYNNYSKLLSETEEAPGAPATYDRNAFSNSVMSYFDSYGRKVAAMIAEVSGTEEALNAAEENVFTNIWDIGVIMKPIYGAEFSEKLVQHVRAAALLELQVVASIKSGWDPKPWIDRFVNNIANDMVNNLTNYNFFWEPLIVRGTWVNIWNHWLEATKAKFNKNQTVFDQNINQANSELRRFGSLMVQGIIQQKPELFFDNSSS